MTRTRRGARLLATAAVAGVLASTVLTGAGGTAQAAASGAVVHTESVAVSAFSTATKASVSGPSLKLGDVRPLGPGRYLVELDVTVRHTSTDPVDLVSIGVGCSDHSNHSESINQWRNTLPGQTFGMQPRLVFTATSTAVCWASGRAMRIVPDAQKSAVRKLAVSGGSFTVTGPLPAGATSTKRIKARSSSGGYVYTSTSRLAQPGRATKTALTTTWVPTGTSAVDVTGDLMMTGCTSRGGSRDATTGTRLLCPQPKVNKPQGPHVDSNIWVIQYGRDNKSWCSRVAVPRTYRSAYLAAAQHHLPRYSQGRLTLNPACGRKLTVYLVIVPRTGPAVMVHVPGTSVSIVPVA